MLEIRLSGLNYRITCSAVDDKQPKLTMNVSGAIPFMPEGKWQKLE